MYEVEFCFFGLENPNHLKLLIFIRSSYNLCDFLNLEPRELIVRLEAVTHYPLQQPVKQKETHNDYHSAEEAEYWHIEDIADSYLAKFEQKPMKRAANRANKTARILQASQSHPQQSHSHSKKKKKDTRIDTQHYYVRNNNLIAASPPVAAPPEPFQNREKKRAHKVKQHKNTKPDVSKFTNKKPSKRKATPLKPTSFQGKIEFHLSIRNMIRAMENIIQKRGMTERRFRVDDLWVYHYWRSFRTRVMKL